MSTSSDSPNIPAPSQAPESDETEHKGNTKEQVSANGGPMKIYIEHGPLTFYVSRDEAGKMWHYGQYSPTPKDPNVDRQRL